ncbi:phosphomevalonate kinase [Kitasatospora sp. NPDC094011]|uniref:phosphomevalonate kinase n=1 Tax=Kitasatospora sp. NPDC094011 TaxID=3364090 RepID=UPI00382F1938
MTYRPPITRHAPGKLFVAGEYAVVRPGTPAVLVAVDREVTATVSDPGTDPDGAEVTVISDLCPVTTRLRHGASGLTGRGADDEQRARISLAHVVSALDVVCALLVERGLPKPALSVAVSSGLHDNGRKYGLGSSGAVTVATIASVTDHCGLSLTAEEWFRLALLATARLDPKASGGDLAASTWGGWIAYQAPDRIAVLELADERGVEAMLRAPWPGFAVRRLPPPQGLALEVGWTGEPVSTEVKVKRLDTDEPGRETAYREFLVRSTTHVRDLVGALERADDREVLHRIACVRRNLAQLDTQAQLGIFTDQLIALCHAAEAVGGAGKPSGAGGGDCGIAFVDAAARSDIAQMRERWTAAGVMPLDVRPADRKERMQ